jgi:hypothetical protein
MSENFTPLSSQLGIAGTSYRIQLGKIGDSWAVRLVKGNDVVASTTLSELNGNLVVGFVMQETAIPNLNPYQISKTVQFITKEAQGNELRMKSQGGGIPAPESEEPTQTLKKSPTPRGAARAPALQPAASEDNSELMSDEDTRATYRVVAHPRQEEEEEAPVSQVAPRGKASGDFVVIGKDRGLSPVPSAEGEGAPAPAPKSKGKAASAAAPKVKAVPAAAPKAKAAPAAAAAPKAGGDASVADLLKKIDARLAKIEERLDSIEQRLSG